MNIGIAGAGMIVPGFLEAAKKLDFFQLKAICATRRSAKRQKSLADQYGIREIYDDYDAMLDDDDLDMIYVAVPNDLHYLFCAKALEKGKSVICEKPFCSSFREAKKLSDLAREKGLWLFEAISNQYFPNYEKVKELLPKLGPIRMAELSFCQHSSRYDQFKEGIIHPVFDPEKSGGALMDLNVYNIHFVTGLFGEPASIHYDANIQKGVDTSGVLVLTYPGHVCVLSAAKDSTSPPRVSIQGEAGYIYGESKANFFERFSWTDDKTKETVDFSLNEEKERLYYELKAFADMVVSGDRAGHDRQLEHSLLVQKILDEARRQVGIRVIDRA